MRTHLPPDAKLTPVDWTDGDRELRGIVLEDGTIASCVVWTRSRLYSTDVEDTRVAFMAMTRDQRDKEILEGKRRPPVTLPTGAAVPDRLVTFKEAAALTGDPETSIRRWVERQYDEVAPTDRCGGPRGVAKRFWLSEILARRPRRDACEDVG